MNKYSGLLSKVSLYVRNPATKSAVTVAGKAVWAYLLPLISFELLLAFHVVVGVFAYRHLGNTFLRVGDLLFVFSLIVGIWVFLNDRIYTRHKHWLWHFHSPAMIPSILVIAFTFWGLLSVYWSSSQDYALLKSIHMVEYILWPFLAVAYLIVPNPNRTHRFIKILAFSALLTAVLAIGLWISTMFYWRPLSVFGSTYYGIGKMAGVGIIISTIWLLRGIELRFSVAVWTLSLLTLIISGARTPFLALILIFLPWAILRFRISSLKSLFSRRKFARYIAITLVGVGIILPLGIGLAKEIGIVQWFGLRVNTFIRMGDFLTNPNQDASTSVRLVMLEKTAEKIPERWGLGYGLGSWPVKLGYGDTKFYPHNLFAEVWFELGLVGVLLLMWICWLCLKQLGRWSLMYKDTTKLIVLVLFIYYFINAQTFNDLPGNRMLFVMLALMVGVSDVKSQSKAEPGFRRTAKTSLNTAARR